jgi:aminobenzoyl-glutamate utilization protein B
MSEWTKQIAEGAALMSGTKVEIQTIDAMMELLPNKALTRLADANIALVGPPRFSAEDERFAAELSRALERRGVKGGQAPYFDTEIHHPNLELTFPDVPGGRYSTDVGNVSWVTPTVSFSAPTWVRGTINHSWAVVAQGAARPALTATLSAGKWMAATALDIVTDPRPLREIKDEHQKQLAQSRFRHPIPKDLRVPTFREVHGRDWESVPKPATYKQL